MSHRPKILGLGTAVPPYCIDQEILALDLANKLNFESEWKSRLIKIFKKTRIKKRYTVIPDYRDNFFNGALYDTCFPESIPGSFRRNIIYQKEAPLLASAAVKKALDAWGQDPQKITHIISVSCTGMMAPGIEFLLVDMFGLSRYCSKLGINFMGCFGAFRALNVAASFAKQDPEARILIVCTELCSLHMQATKNIGSFVSNALFSDGAAAAIIGSETKGNEKPLWEIENFLSFAMPDSKNEMTWELGDTGLLMGLSERVPKMVKREIAKFCDILARDKEVFSNCLWAPHPGGPAILDAIADEMELNSEMDLKSSWHVLQNFGNMSSATFLFVLEEMVASMVSNPKKWSIGLGFGPGLSLEGILLQNVSKGLC